jgi:hypothetical protein
MADDRVALLNNDSGEVVGYCTGPTATGSCPSAGLGGVVGCAGYRIAPPNASSVYWLMWVPVGSRQCPLSWDLEYVGM